MERSNMGEQDHTRLVYGWKRIIDVDDVRTTSLDAHDPIVVLGNAKGYVAPWLKDQSKKNNVSIVSRDAQKVTRNIFR